MALGFPGFRPGGGGGPAGIVPVMCNECGTNRHLIIRSVTELADGYPGVVMASYICGRCQKFSEHPSHIADLSAVLGRREQSGGVLIFGRYYMHCGQPMEKAGSELRRLSAPLSTEGADGDPLDVYLSTRVLRCVCGFQMELPE